MVYHFITTIFCMHACVYERERGTETGKNRDRDRETKRERECHTSARTLQGDKE